MKIYKYLMLVLLSAGLFLLYMNNLRNGFLEFSDAAKYADISKNLVQGKGFGINFAFWNPEVFNQIKETVFPAYFYPPLPPLFYAFSFILFGLSDASVFITSAIFYTLLTLFSYLLAKKVFGEEIIAVLSALAVAVNISVLDYASNGASEILFMLGIVSSFLFFSLKKKRGDIAGVFLLVATYFTRPQAFIFILGAILFWLLLHFKTKPALVRFLGVIILGTIIDRTILVALSGKYFFYSITSRGLNAFSSIGLAQSPSEMLRGAVSSGLNLIVLGKKVFYNLYNFYKLLPRIASPYMWGLFVIGLFHWGKNRVENSLKVATIFMVTLTFLVTALTIPFFRYLHPVVPLVYLFATATLVWIVQEIANGQWLMVKKWPLIKKLSKEKFIILTSSFLILFFVVGQTLGVIFLDSRFQAKLVNRGKPPVYVQLSWKLKEITNPNDVIITNLDTWGSWYGERKTVWFPLKPDQLIPPEGSKNPFDAIYLTSYLMDDENYYMGEEWRQIFYHPENPEDKFIAENYELRGVYEIPASETYEKQDARAVLLIRE